MLNQVGTLGRGVRVEVVTCVIGLTATTWQFAGIVTARVGKTAREGGNRMAQMGHAEEQCRHITWGPSERSRDQRRRGARFPGSWTFVSTTASLSMRSRGTPRGGAGRRSQTGRWR